jgi:hypothetical protein
MNGESTQIAKRTSRIRANQRANRKRKRCYVQRYNVLKNRTRSRRKFISEALYPSCVRRTRPVRSRTTSAGTPVKPKAACAFPPKSYASGRVTCRRSTTDLKRSGVSPPASLATTTNSISPLSRSSSWTRASSGSSAMQGPHVVAKKSITRTFPALGAVGTDPPLTG